MTLRLSSKKALGSPQNSVQLKSTCKEELQLILSYVAITSKSLWGWNQLLFFSSPPSHFWTLVKGEIYMTEAPANNKVLTAC